MKVEVIKKDGKKICTEAIGLFETEKRLVVKADKQNAEMYFKEEIKNVSISI